MRRGVVIALVVMGAVLAILAIALAKVGTQLDQAKIERDDLKLEVEDLRDEVNSISGERETLQGKTQEQLKTIDQLKAEVEHLKTSSQASAPAMTPAPATGSSASTP